MKHIVLVGLVAVASFTQVHPTKRKKQLKSKVPMTRRKYGDIEVPPQVIPKIDTRRIGKALSTRDTHTSSSRSKKIMKQKNLHLTNSIHQADLDPEFGLVINSPGKYYLAEDVSFIPSGKDRNAISIEADCVTLDLNEHCIRQSNETAGGVGIFIGRNRSNITLLNGTIINFSQWGIGVLNSENITVDKIITDGCGDLNFTESAGLAMSGCSNVFVMQSLFTHCRGVGLLIQSINTGSFSDIQSTHTLEVTNLSRLQTIAAGMRVSESSSVSIQQCSFSDAEASFASGLHIHQSRDCAIHGVIACNNRAKSVGISGKSSSSAGIIVTKRSGPSEPRNNSLYFRSCICSNNSTAPSDDKFTSAYGFIITHVDSLRVEDCHSTSNYIEGTPSGSASGFVLFENNNALYTNCTASSNRCKAGFNFRTGKATGFSITQNRNAIIDLCSTKDNSVQSGASSLRSEIGIELTNVSGTLSNCSSSGHKRLIQDESKQDGIGFLIKNDQGQQLTVRNNSAIDNTGGGFIDLNESGLSAIYRDNRAFTVNTVNFSTNFLGNSPIDTWILGSLPTNFSALSLQWSNISINQLPIQ